MDKKIILKPFNFRELIWKHFINLSQYFQKKINKLGILRFSGLQYIIYTFTIICIPLIIAYICIKKLLPRFQKKRSHIIGTYLLQIIPSEILQNTNSKLLDLGSGDGYIAEQLLQKNLDVTKIDVENYDNSGENITLYDGKVLPYQNKSFNLVMVNFILHHTHNLLDILQEVIRVSDKYIIISEDIIDTYFDKILGTIHAITYDGIDYKNNFHSSQEWNKIFSGLNLQVIKTIDIPRMTWKMYKKKQKIYLLQINTV